MQNDYSAMNGQTYLNGCSTTPSSSGKLSDPESDTRYEEWDVVILKCWIG